MANHSRTYANFAFTLFAKLLWQLCLWFRIIIMCIGGMKSVMAVGISVLHYRSSGELPVLVRIYLWLK
jgi:hypothetical protein